MSCFKVNCQFCLRGCANGNLSLRYAGCEKWENDREGAFDDYFWWNGSFIVVLSDLSNLDVNVGECGCTGILE